jgi:hypothetical protein
MDPENELVRLENAGWQALVDGTGRSHYQGVLADDAVVLMSGAGMAAGLVTGDAVLERLSGATWAWGSVPPRCGAWPTGHLPRGRRDFDAEYQAVVSSTYVFDGDEWKLRVHQQTPV